MLDSINHIELKYYKIAFLGHKHQYFAFNIYAMLLWVSFMYLPKYVIHLV